MLQRWDGRCIVPSMGGFVKLDQGILNSSLWHERDVRDMFITSLLLAVPQEITEPIPALASLGPEPHPDGFVVPPGWYGFVPAAGIGIARLAHVDRDRGIRALEVLASAEADSRTPDYDGRRMVRVAGGFIILNWEKYRQRDYTSTERSRRWRERQRALKASGTPSHPGGTPSPTVRDASRVQSTEAEVQSTEADAQIPPKPPKGEGRGKGPKIPDAKKPDGVNEALWQEWLTTRKSKRWATSQRVLDGALRKGAEGGLDAASTLTEWLEGGYQGYFPNRRSQPRPGSLEERTRQQDQTTFEDFDNDPYGDGGGE